MLEWPSPKSVFEVRIFHDLASFYRKFIRNFSKMSTPILETMKKNHQPFRWTDDAEKGFQMLKNKITKQLVLVLPNFNKVRTKASDDAIAAVLSREDRPIAYYNEQLNEARRKYTTYDKKFYAKVQALKKWRYYLLSREFILYTNNHARVYNAAP